MFIVLVIQWNDAKIDIIFVPINSGVIIYFA